MADIAGTSSKRGMRMPLDRPLPPPVPTLFERVRACLRLSTWLSIALIAMIWGATLFHLRNDEHRALQSAQDRTTNIARIFEEHVANLIESIDKNLLFLRAARENNPSDFDLPAWTTNSYFLRDVTVQMALIGPDGRLVATNVDKNAQRMDLSDREHFRVHRDRSSDELFISKPVLGRATGKWTIQLTRRLTDAAGNFDGVLVASLDPYHLSQFFESIDLGKEGAITLLGEDGLIRARGGLDPQILGRSIEGSDLFRLISQFREGVQHGQSPITPGRRIVAFRHLDDFPLIVTVGMSEFDVLAGHRLLRDRFLWSAAGLTLLVVAFMLVGAGHELRLLRGRLEREHDAQRLAAKTQELETTLARIGQGILMIDPHGRCRIANDQAVHLLGADTDLEVGREVPPAVLKRLGIGDRSDDTFDIPVGDRDVQITRADMPDGGTLFTLTDITVHRRAEAVLVEARDRAEAATQARTAFLATMSHELRTPLNGVVGTIRLLEDSDTPAERDLYVATMRQSAEHLLQIIDDILDIAKLESDRVAFAEEPFAIASMIRTAADLVAPRAREKGLTIEVDIADGVPPALVGDAGRLRQILVNLLGNAVKFTERGRVRLAIDTPPDAPAGRARLRLRVHDTGIGIAPEMIGHLFVKFSQLDGSITRRFGGTGLGLAISRELIEKMGGEISVTSTLGEGSTFTVVIDLPIADTGPQRAAAPVVAEARRREGLEILLAEDNPTNTFVATRLLEKMGHRVSAVVDGQAALEALAARSFDVVLMDVMMPRLDGLAATRRIRAGAAGDRAVPIVALTANALAEDRLAALAAGANAYTTKPVSKEKLSSAIAEALVTPPGGGPEDLDLHEEPPLRAIA